MSSPAFLRAVLAVAAIAVAAPVPNVANVAAQAEVLAYSYNGGIDVSTPPGAQGLPVVAQGGNPAVSPDGSRLAWSAPASDRYAHIFVAPIAGGAGVQVTSGPATDQSPAWSPDGTRLALTRFGSDGIEHLALVDADGANGQVLDIRGSAPSWSPDGRFLAFRAGDEVDAIDPAGRGESMVSSELGQPSWSPDGTRLAVVYNDVRLIDVATRQSTVVLARKSDTFPFVFYEDVAFNAAGDRLYARRVEIVDKPTSTDDIRRYTLDGQPDPTFTSVPQDVGYGFGANRMLSVGGGSRQAPVQTAPAAVTQLTGAAAPSRAELTWTAPPPSGQFAGFTVRYAKGSTPPATVTDGAAAGDTLGDSLRVGRLDPSTTYSYSVFTRDWSGAASPPTSVPITTPAAVATTVTLTGPGTVTYGQGSLLSGQLVREDTGAPIAGATLTLLGHHTGLADTRLGTLTTDSEGRFVTRRLTSEATRYTIRYAGSTPLVAASANTLVLVKQRITIRFSPSSHVAAHSVATVTATVAPAFPGGRVRIQGRLYSRGVDVLTRLDNRSRATVRLDTRQRQADAHDNVIVTPGARTGFLTDPTFATYTVT